MPNRSVIQIVATECPSSTDEEFDTWYSEIHIPDLLKAQGLKKVTRYKILGSNDEKYPRYLAIYEFNNQNDFESYFKSPERTKALEDWTHVKKKTGASVKWRVQYEAIKTWMK